VLERKLGSLANALARRPRAVGIRGYYCEVHRCGLVTAQHEHEVPTSYGRSPDRATSPDTPQ
ncbi:MAG: hypothetical protein K8R89_09320, partial [Anaerolineae bacterium]|nr:hypothetical protein [Anaerolineae bacterium]